MICKTCRGKIDDLSLYCTNCGEPSENHRKQFILKDILKQTENVKQTAQYVIGIALAIFAIIAVVNFKPSWIGIADTAIWLKYIIVNISMVLLIPCLMLPFRPIGYVKPLHTLYLRLVHFTLYMCLYFFVLKVVCQGDPILNLVRFIMILWGLAVVFPVPYLLMNSEKQQFTTQEKTQQAASLRDTDDSVELIIKKAYIAGKYLRWKQFYLCVYLGVRIFITVFSLFILLPQTLQYTFEVLGRWFRQQNKLNLYTQKSDY